MLITMRKLPLSDNDEIFELYRTEAVEAEELEDLLNSAAPSEKDDDDEDEDEPSHEDDDDSDDEEDSDDADEDEDDDEDDEPKGKTAAKIKDLQSQYHDLLCSVFTEHSEDCIEHAIESCPRGIGDNINTIVDCAIEELRRKVYDDLGIELSHDERGFGDTEVVPGKDDTSDIRVIPLSQILSNFTD